MAGRAESEVVPNKGFRTATLPDADLAEVVEMRMMLEVRGYGPAEQHDERLHQVKVIDPGTGRPVSATGRTWTSVFGEEMVRLAAERDDIVAVTAAMSRSVAWNPSPAATGTASPRTPGCQSSTSATSSSMNRGSLLAERSVGFAW
ncbi:hypothetical protein [Pseudonocardia sp. DLS-67]